MQSPVLYDAAANGVVTLTINRPDLRNPISEPDVIEGLLGALERIEADPTVRVAILTGAGKAFSSGGNINAMKPNAGGLNGGLPARTRGNYRRGIQRLVPQRRWGGTPRCGAWA